MERRFSVTPCNDKLRRLAGREHQVASQAQNGAETSLYMQSSYELPFSKTITALHPKCGLVCKGILQAGPMTARWLPLVVLVGVDTLIPRFRHTSQRHIRTATQLPLIQAAVLHLYGLYSHPAPCMLRPNVPVPEQLKHVFTCLNLICFISRAASSITNSAGG